MTFWLRHYISRQSLKLGIFMNKSNSPHIMIIMFIILVSIGNVTLEKSLKVFLNLLGSNTTNIVKNIFIFPTEDIQKNNT